MIASLGLLVVALIAGACSSGTRTVDERVTDSVITSTIQQRLAADPILGPALDESSIDVATAVGVVTLTGQVPRESLRARAEALAREVDGVQDVQNLIRVTGRGG